MENNLGHITFGQQIGSLNISGFILTETIHPPHLVLPRHDHQCANINLTLEGSFRETVGNLPQECETASFLVKPPGESHGNKYGRSGAHCLIIELLPQRLEEIRKLTNLFNAPAHIKGGTGSIIARRIYQEFRQRTDGFELIIEGLILEILGQSARQNKTGNFQSPPRWLGEARELIRQHFSEKLSLYSIAEVIQIHPSHLARMFRKHYHCSVGEYVRRLRIEFAAQEMLQSDLSLAEIALAAGFNDQSHFTNEFKRQMRTTPVEYKKVHTRNALTKKH
jgi:AraC family transcriptional regulator